MYTQGYSCLFGIFKILKVCKCDEKDLLKTPLNDTNRRSPITFDAHTSLFPMDAIHACHRVNTSQSGQFHFRKNHLHYDPTNNTTSHGQQLIMLKHQVMVARWDVESVFLLTMLHHECNFSHLPQIHEEKDFQLGLPRWPTEIRLRLRLGTYLTVVNLKIISFNIYHRISNVNDTTKGCPLRDVLHPNIPQHSSIT